MDRTLENLAEAAAAGDRRAAARLIEALYARIYAFLRRLARNDADAADLTQRTFARVWQGISTFAGRSTFASWVHSIAYHTYQDWLRSNRRFESRPDDWWTACACAQPAPDEQLARNDSATAVYSLVERLEPALRDSLHLHYYQGLTLEETADALGVATSTIKYRLRQAISELQKQLAEPFRHSTVSPA